MIYSLSTGAQIAFIVVTVLAGIALLVFFVGIPCMKIWIKRHFQKYIYHKVYSIALTKDYYLVNNFTFTLDESHQIVVDHLLFGNKYIYVFLDKYFEGDLIGKIDDPSFIFVAKNGARSYIDNLFDTSKRLLSYLSSVTGIPTELLIGITAVNNDCKLNIESSSKQFYVVQRNKINRLISLIESRNLGRINPTQLEKAVAMVDKINKRDKK